MREALKRGSPASASPKGWKQCFSRGNGELLCSEGSGRRDISEELGLGGGEGAGEGKGREVERQGAQGQAKSSILSGAPRRTRLSWGMGAKGRGGYWEGPEGRGQGAPGRDGYVLVESRERWGAWRDRSGSLRGRLGMMRGGAWESSRRGLCQGGKALGAATGLWAESAAGRGSCRALLAPHPQRGGDHSSRPSPPVKEPSLCSGFFGLGCEPLEALMGPWRQNWLWGCCRLSPSSPT